MRAEDADTPIHLRCVCVFVCVYVCMCVCVGGWVGGGLGVCVLCRDLAHGGIHYAAAVISNTGHRAIQISRQCTGICE